MDHLNSIVSRYDLRDAQEIMNLLAASVAAAMTGRASHEHIWFSTVWSAILAGLAPDVEFPHEAARQHAFLWCLDALERQRNPHIGAEEFPRWLHRDWLDTARASAASLKSSLPSNARTQIYRDGTSELADLANHGDFHDWCEDMLQVRLAQHKAVKYIFYQSPGQRCDVHIDNAERFQYNCLIGVEKSKPETSAGSVLRLFTMEDEVDIDICPGTAVVFHAGRTAHGRTPLGTSESVCLISVGLSPEK